MSRDEWVRRRIEANVHPSNFAKNPDAYLRDYRRRYAQEQVHRAVRRGDLLKPSECSNCGRGPLPSKDLHGHHWHYDQPLSVQWLCRDCHLAAHKVPTR
jgi:hypothetical protein